MAVCLLFVTKIWKIDENAGFVVQKWNKHIFWKTNLKHL